MNLQNFKDKHKGNRCFILGNGPSLLNMDLSLLQNEMTFGSNGIYAAYSHKLPNITYYVLSDSTFFEFHGNELKEYNLGVKFFREDVIEKNQIDSNNYDISLGKLQPMLDVSSINFNLEKGLYRGHSVTIDALQLAFYMDFHTYYLIGCDFNYDSGRIYENKSTNAEIMPLDKVEQAFYIMKELFQKNNKIILNATEGGDLNVFEKIGYDSIF